MNKTLIALFALCLILPGGIAFAQQLGNPAQLVEKGAFSVGLQGTYLFKQKLEDHTVNRVFSDGTVTHKREENTSFEDDTFTMATITYGLMDRLNVFFKSGVAAGGSWYLRGADPGWEGKLNTCFVWGVGAKGTVLQLDHGWNIGLGVQYFRYDNRNVDNWKRLDSGITAEAMGWHSKDEIDYWELDVVATVSWNLGCFTPYLGAGYNYSHITVTGDWANTSGISYHDDASFTGENKWTVITGLDLEIVRNFKVNLHGTFISNTALTLGISYRF